MLVKAYDARAFPFFSAYDRRKGREWAVNRTKNHTVGVFGFQECGAKLR